MKKTSMNEQTCQCPLSEDRMKLLIRMPVDGITGRLTEYGNIYQCQKCQYAAVMPRPKKEDVSTFYQLDKYYTQGKSHFADGGKISLLDKVRIHIAWRFDRSVKVDQYFIHNLLEGKPAKICEIGCGSGALLKQLQERGHSTYGVEPDLKSNSFNQNLAIYPGTAENIPEEIRSKQFDLVIFRHVLEHCLDPSLALKNAYALLKTGGYIVCEVPNNESTGSKQSGASWAMLDVPRHLNFFTPSSLHQIFQQSGFKIAQTNFRGYCRQFSNSWINTEAEIWERSTGVQVEPEPIPKKNSKIRAWKLLLLTLFAKSQKKYDSVSVVAVKS